VGKIAMVKAGNGKHSQRIKNNKNNQRGMAVADKK
jgi:hypothetical protein